ncbi:MAG: tyrosine-type recombinase/integrase [Gallionella sp.]|nr:tyrosine-type recombinase/integrase [Gallionella sp.]
MKVEGQRCQTAWTHPDQAKAGKPIPVPLSDNAVAILQRWEGRNEKYVFVFEGKPVVQTATKTWRTACASVGLKNFRWHDLRHTWASWHAQDGTPLNVLQELGGWESAQVGKYDANGHYTLEVPYADPTELIMDILRQWHHVEVLEPAELRLEIRKEAELMANAYK